MRHELKNYSLVDVPTNIDRRIQLIGVAVGDILKQYYYANQKNDGFRKDVFPDTSDVAENENDKLLFNKFLKKSLLVDTTMTDIPNVLGLYLFENKSINLWDHLKIDGIVSKEQNKFEEFCKKILYLSIDSINSLMSKNIDKTLFVREEACLNMFNTLSDKTIVGKILGYYFYNENPEFVYDSRAQEFNPPKSIPDILKYMKEKYNDNHCLDMYNKIMKKLNNHEQKNLAEKYPAITFNSCEKIPEEYPIYSLRNVYIKYWEHNDVSRLKYMYFEQRLAIKNNKYKYKSTISDKTIPINYAAYRGGKNYNKHLSSQKETQKQFSGLVRETFDMIDNY